MATSDDKYTVVDLHGDLANFRKASLSSAVADVDKIIDLLSTAQNQIAEATDPHTASLTITKLQNPIRDAFDAVNEDLKDINKAHKALGKSLDKAMPLRPLPTETDAMAAYPALLNRAILMHLLREGDFQVSSTFVEDSQDYPPSISLPSTTPRNGHQDSFVDDNKGHSREGTPQHLQDKFAEMYSILEQICKRNLLPAIDWVYANSEQLEARSSTLEFDLAKLQYIWLFKGQGQGQGLPNAGGKLAALAYARERFGRFQKRHLRETRQLLCGMVYASNMADSPYRNVFDTSTAFDDIALDFTRDFCSLLGLAAQSPLHLAATAGAIALPPLLKFTAYAKAKRTEWTSENELAFETPLPRSMIYHPIFVCPVLKVQTTEQNPPMMLSCGHVICREALQGLSKTTKYKCPYCPIEGVLRDAVMICF